MLELRNLSIGYIGKKETTTVASAINAIVPSSQMTCLLGANGVGKSTLLRTITRFQPKLEGQILIDNSDIDTLTEKQMARKIGVVLTERPSVQDMTVTDLVSLGRSPYTGFFGKLEPKDLSAVETSIEQAGIKRLADRTLDTLSDGERQRAFIAKALAQATPVICLDEPTSFLDFPSKVEIMKLLSSLSHETGKTIFLSTHDVELAIRIADNLWLMHSDGTFTIGTPRQLALDGSLSRFFDSDTILFDPSSMTIRIKN